MLYLGPSDAKGAAYVFPDFKKTEHKTDDITKVVIERKTPTDSDLVFERDDDKNWKITSPRNLPTESGVVSRMIEAIADAKFDEEGKPSSRKAAGVDSPTRIIKLTGKDKNGKEVNMTLTIGEVTPGEDNVVFVLSSARSKTPLAVPKRDLASALENVNYFRAKNLFGDDTADVRVIKLSEGKKGKTDKVEFRKEKTNWAHGGAALRRGRRQ